MFSCVYLCLTKSLFKKICKPTTITELDEPQVEGQVTSFTLQFVSKFTLRMCHLHVSWIEIVYENLIEQFLAKGSNTSVRNVETYVDQLNKMSYLLGNE